MLPLLMLRMSATQKLPAAVILVLPTQKYELTPSLKTEVMEEA